MQFSIEIDDKGDFVGQVPSELDAILKRVETTAHGAGYGKGVAKAAEDAKKQIEDTVKAKLAEHDAILPLERAKWSQVEEENKALQTRLIESNREYDRTLKTREETHAKELLDRADALKKRDSRIRQLVKAQIRGEAVRAGAREESLTELELILSAHVSFDDDMEPVIKGEDGQPMTVHGKTVSLEQFVAKYVSDHPHHRKPAGGQGAGTRGGASFQHGMTDVSIEQAGTRIDQGDRSASAINDLFLATRKKRSA